MERDWIDFTNAGGSIATAATLIWVLIKEFKTRKHITDLTVLVREMQQQNEISRQQNEISRKQIEIATKQFEIRLRPAIFVESVSWDERSINVTLINNGHTTTIHEMINASESDFDLDLPFLPKEWIQGKAIQLKFRFKGNGHFYKPTWNAIIYTTDPLGIHHGFSVIGKGTKHADVIISYDDKDLN
jgi:hypothetical protein